ncbi:heme exporter protein CcmB [Pelagibius sp.]|uniref:heme exporter protein CcmB n=1 Tax=Pelagibius sp. TaxID=1931238 RepID=UPI00260B23AD|nr:heme exporter protein CcmB [Pelagibius sp.]
MKGLAVIVGRDLRLALRQSADAWLAVLFFVLTAALFPFGIGPEPNLLRLIAPGVIWVVALLAVLLSLERLFLADYEDGSLEQLLLSPLPLELAILGKVAAHWLTTGLPLIAAAPLLAVLFNMDLTGLGVLLLAMLLGTPVLSLIGAVGAALTLGARRGGVLIPLLVLPLYVPALIFGVGATEAALADLSARPNLLFLGALLLVMLLVTPLAAAAALRQALE